MSEFLIDEPWKQLVIVNILERPAERSEKVLKRELIVTKDCYLNVLVFARDAIQKQIECPSTGDTPVTTKIL